MASENSQESELEGRLERMFQKQAEEQAAGQEVSRLQAEAVTRHAVAVEHQNGLLNDLLEVLYAHRNASETVATEFVSLLDGIGGILGGHEDDCEGCRENVSTMVGKVEEAIEGRADRRDLWQKSVVPLLIAAMTALGVIGGAYFTSKKAAAPSPPPAAITETVPAGSG